MRWMRTVLPVGLMLASCVTARQAVAQATTNALEIGGHEQLFLDDYVVARTENITRRINVAHKHPDPLVPADPWAGGLKVIFGTALRDGDEGRFKMWYYDTGNMAYATSRDGLRWKEPRFDIFLRGYRSPTNIVVYRPSMYSKAPEGVETKDFAPLREVCGVVKDPRDPDETRRYKAAFVSIEGRRRGLGTAVSPDGIHWRVENGFATEGIRDISRFFWDETLKRFVLYGRVMLADQPPDSPWAKWGRGRAVARTASADFREWTKPQLVLAADPQDPSNTETYSMSVFPYEGVYIGLVQMYYADREVLNFQLAVSRDGLTWTRVSPRDEFLPMGDVGSWDRFNVSLGNLPPVSVGDEWWFYYGARTVREHSYRGPDSGPRIGRIGLAKVRRGRLVSLEASFDGGTVVTKPLAIDGVQLSLNANARWGHIEVELLGADERPVPGWTARVERKDAIAIPVGFENGGFGPLRDRPVRFRFTLHNARLYGFRVE